MNFNFQRNVRILYTINPAINYYKLFIRKDLDLKIYLKKKQNTLQYMEEFPCLSVGAKLLCVIEIKPFASVFILCCYKVLFPFLS